MAERRTARMVYRVGLSPEEYVLPTGRFDPDEDLFSFDDLTSRATSDADAVVESREGGRWEKHRRRGREMICFGRRVLRRLLRTQEKIDDSVGSVAELDDARCDRSGIPEDLTAEELLEHVRAQLGEEVAATVADAERLDRELESGPRSPAEFEGDPDDSTGATLWNDVLAAQRGLGIWYVAAGYEESFRADFFAAVDRAEPERGPELSVEAVEREVERLSEEVTDHLQGLYGAVATADWDSVERRARQGIDYPFEVRRDLVRLGETVRRARLARERSDEWHADDDVMEIGRVEADLHEVTWELTMLLAASYRFLFVAGQRAGHPEATAEVEVAREAGFRSQVADGESVPLDDLLETPEAYDGALVATGGYVEDLRYDADAPGSKFELVDVWNDRRVRVFLPFRNLHYWSIREGAYVRLHGTFAAESEYVDGDPEIELDVVGLGEHADESWLDHVARSLAADDIFDRYPSRTNASWSLEPPAGTDEPLMTDGGSSDDGSGDGGESDGDPADGGAGDGSDGGIGGGDGGGIGGGDGGGIGGGDGGGIGGGDGGGIGGGGHVCPSPPIDLDDFDFEDGDLKYDLSDDWNLYGSGGADPPYVELGVEYEW